MADDKPDDKTADSNADDGKEAAEKSFWDKLRTEVGGIVDEKLKAVRTDDKSDGSPNPGTSRTGARRITLQTLISDLVYGPPKDQ